MPINREKGKYASNQGIVLENQVKSILEQKGFKIVSFTEWKNTPDAYGKNYYSPMFLLKIFMNTKENQNFY